MIVTDIDNDLCYVSSKVVNQKTIDFYSQPKNVHLSEKCSNYKNIFIGHLDNLMNSYTEQTRLARLNEYVSDLE